MKNNIHRMVACALSLALLPLCFLSSCKDNGQGDMTSTGDDSTGTPEPQVLTVVDKSEAKLTVVRPEADPGATTRFAKALRTKLNNYFKAEFPFSDDWYDPSISSITPVTESYELLVGDVDREESRTAKAELQAGEYMIRVTDKKVVIVGWRSPAVISSLKCANIPSIPTARPTRLPSPSVLR